MPADATTLAEIDAALESWEGQHTSQCEDVRDDGQFFGFKEVGQARLEQFTKFLFVPAVRDATEDGVEGKGSVLTELLDLAVRSALAERGDVRTFQEGTKRRFDALMSLEQLPELTELRDNLADTLRRFAPGPRNRDFCRTGGRALAAPNLILRIEEPELYQLATGRIRLLGKVQGPGSSKPKQACVFRATLQDVARTLDSVQDTPSGSFTADRLNEGFFANVVVLSVIPCGGKTAIDKPATIFKAMGIDAGGQSNSPPAVRRDMNTTLRGEFAIAADRDPEKNPVLLAKLIQEAAATGQVPRSIGAIVDAIMKLRERGRAG